MLSNRERAADMSYNGWTNYETWNVSLWLDNDEGSYSYVREMAREVAAEHADDDPDDVMTRKPTGDLADKLKEMVEELPEVSSVTDSASMASDLLGHALSVVNWHEIAEGVLSELD